MVIAKVCRCTVLLFRCFSLDDEVMFALLGHPLFRDGPAPVAMSCFSSPGGISDEYCRRGARNTAAGVSILQHGCEAANW